jgi:mannose-6-phosphate isomerase-like protein (cupin superfamily)
MRVAYAAVEYAMHERDDPSGRLFDAGRGCSVFSQRVLRFTGNSGERVDHASDEVLYVLDGTGTLTVDGVEHELATGTAAFVGAGVSSMVAGADALAILSVVVHDPEPATAAGAVIDLAASERQSATAGRQFVLGATPELGCASVTQFVGLIPPGRAPDHFHTYDEVIYVLEGEGFLEIAGEQAPLRPGSCVHLPARLVHCLANTGATELRVLGVFRPAGSPAEAYYPDGTLAVPAERS